jgi:hypothetical protein
MNVAEQVNYEELARCTDDFNGAQLKVLSLSPSLPLSLSLSLSLSLPLSLARSLSLLPFTRSFRAALMT